VAVKQSEEVFTISKGERYFYDALLKMVSPADVANAKSLVLARFKQEQMEQIEREAEEQEGQQVDTLKQGVQDVLDKLDSAES